MGTRAAAAAAAVVAAAGADTLERTASGLLLPKPAVLKLIYGVERDPVVAQAGEGYWQLTPPPLDIPLEWLSDEAADAAPPKLRVFPDGRVAGVVAPEGRCLLDGSGECWMVPRPADGRGSRLCAPNTDDGDYYMAHVGSTMTDQGEVATGTLAGPGGHANGQVGPQAAKKYYDDSDWQVARGRYVWSDTAGGVTFVGALYPWVTERQVATIRASACSVDYRWIMDEAQYRLIATCLVNVGGFPSRYAAAVDSGFILTAARVLELAEEVGLPRVASASAVTPQYEGMVIDHVIALMEQQLAVHAGAVPTPGYEVPSTADDTAPAQEDHMKIRAAAAPVVVHAPDEAGTGQGGTTAVIDPPAADASTSATTGPQPCVDCGTDSATADAQAAATDAQTSADDAATAAAPAHTAAYELEDIPGGTSAYPDLPPNLLYGDQLTWGGDQVGMFCDPFLTVDGQTMLSVFVEVGGVLQMDRPLLVPVAAVTQTGRFYHYTEPDWCMVENMVLPEDQAPDVEVGEGVPTAGEGDTEDMAMAASAGTPAGRARHAAVAPTVGSRLAAGRVPNGSAITPVEHKLATVEQRDAAVQAQLASIGETLTSLTAIVTDLHQERLAAQVASL